jgi:protein-S-isoprenylcysteine O-methyltransferase Ste14
MNSSKIYNATPDATLVCSIILAYFLNRYLPVVNIVSFPISLLGWLVAVAGFSLAIYILNGLRARHTSTDATGAPSALATDGVYSFSRNPFYLSYLITATGAAIILGSLTAFVAPIICFAVLSTAIIPLEEKNLQKRFGQSYIQYKHRVRRWI